jgi:hypothetical protein
MFSFLFVEFPWLIGTVRSLYFNGNLDPYTIITEAVFNYMLEFYKKLLFDHYLNS